MSISDIKINRNQMAKTGFVYFGITLFCVLFGAIYEIFSHEVYSYYMIYAFVIPLVAGVLPFFVLAFSSLPLPGKVSLNLYHSGIAAWIIGCIFQGILEIYGTTNRLILIYWILGAVFLLLGIILYLIGAKNGR